MAAPAKKIIVAVVILFVVGVVALVLVNRFGKPEAPTFGPSTEKAQSEQAGGAGGAGEAGAPGAAGQAGGAAGEAGGEGAQAEAPQLGEGVGQAGIPSEDDVVPVSLVYDLAEYVAAAYHPAGSKRNATRQGKLELSFKQLNMHYGLDPSRFEMSESSAAQARKTILRYVFRAGTIESLYELYGDEFVNDLRVAGEESYRDFPVGSADENRWESRTLTPDQVSEMLRLISQMLAGGGQVFAAIARQPDVLDQVGEYLMAARQVNEAYTRYWKQDEQRQSEGSTAMPSGEEIKSAIILREQLKNALVDDVLDMAGPLPISREEVLYLCQWAFRRNRQEEVQGPAFKALAQSMTDMASRLRVEAAAIKEQGSAG